jgi:hypothetical protein
MSGSNGDGRTHEPGNGEGSRPSLEEIIASFGEPKDSGSRLAIFVGRQTVDIARMIESHTRGMADLLKCQNDRMVRLMTLLAEQVALITAEVTSLKAQRGDGPSESGGTLQ